MLRVNSPTVGEELRAVIFTDVKAIFTAVTGEQRREVYSIRVSKFELSETRLECWYIRVEVISRLPGSYSFGQFKIYTIAEEIEPGWPSL